MKLELLLHILTLSSLYYMKRVDITVANNILVTADSSSSTSIDVKGIGFDIVKVDLLSAISVQGGRIYQDNSASLIITYIPSPGYVGQDWFFFTVTNSFGLTSLPIKALVNVVALAPQPQINVVALAPQAHPRSVKTLSNTPINIKVCGFDSCSRSLEFSLMTLPLHGFVSKPPCDSQIASVMIEYRPHAGFVGRDEFKFVVKNLKSGKTSEPAVVEIFVIEDPLLGSSNNSFSSMVEKYSGL